MTITGNKSRNIECPSLPSKREKSTLNDNTLDPFQSRQRKSIANIIAMGHLLKAMAETLAAGPTSISKEIKRNRSQIVQGPDCPKLKRFPFVCDGYPKRYANGQCSCGKWSCLATKRIGIPKAAKHKKRAERTRVSTTTAAFPGKARREGHTSTASAKGGRTPEPSGPRAQMDYLGSIATDKYAIFMAIITEPYYVIGKKLRKGDSAATAAYFDDPEEVLGPRPSERLRRL